MIRDLKTAWRGVLLVLILTSTLRPLSASTYLWTIFDLDGVTQEQFTFTTALNQVWPDSASEVMFMDPTEWPTCGFFFADSRHFDCSTDLTDQQVMNLSTLLDSTWQLGMNQLFDGSIRENLFDNDLNNGFQSLSVLIQPVGLPATQPADVPEPSTLIPLVAGFALITLSRRLRKRTKSNS